MRPATSAVIKEEHQKENCIYCGTKFEQQWTIKIIDGLERRINLCLGCGKEARRKISKHLSITQLFKAHSLDWGEEVKVNTKY